MKLKVSRSLFLLACTVLVGAVTRPLAGQVLYGSLVGTATDSSGAVVPGATIEVLNTATGTLQTTTSSARGDFAVGDLSAGNYRVTVTAAGFGVLVQNNVTIENNTTRRLTSVLSVAQTSQTVEVTAAPIALQTDRSDVSTQLTQTQIEDLPTNAARNFQSLIRTVPGSTPPANPHSVAGNPQVSLAYNVNGGGTPNNTTKIDGASDMFFWLPEDAAYVPPQEAIEAVNIVTNAFDAEQGLGSSSVTNVTLKSGTNRLHGAAWEYNTISALAAKGYFFAAAKLPKTVLNQFGVDLGGPIFKDKLFFFGDWERTSQITGISKYFTVPTAAEISGNFAGTGTTIYDPTTGTSAGAGRTPFLNNQIPTGEISSAAAKMLALLPAPNVAGNPTTNNYFTSADTSLIRNNVDAKITFTPGQKSRYFGSFSYSPSNVLDPNALGAAGGGSIDGGVPGDAIGTIYRISLGGDYVFTPSLLMDGAFAYTRSNFSGANTDLGQDYGLNVLNIPGTNSGRRAGSNLDGGIPAFNLSTFTSLGDTNASSPFQFRNNNYASNLNLSWNKGTHALRFGGELDHFEIANSQANLTYGVRGGFTFSGGLTALSGGTSPTLYNSLADFELGLPTKLGEDHQYFDPAVVSENIYGLYARDQWQPTHSLTLTYGIRYEFYPSATRDHGLGGIRYDPTNNLVYLGGVNGVPQNAGVNTGHGQIVPRLGANYRIGDKTVIRGGFGMNTNSEVFRNNAQSFPAVISAQYSGANSYAAAGNLVTGIPAFVGPDLSAGTLALPNTYGTYTSPTNYRRGYVENLNLFLERDLGSNIILQVGYVHSHGVRLDTQLNINAAAPGTGKAGQPLYAAFGNASTITLVVPLFSSDYNALQTVIRKKIGRRGNISANYTWGKAMSAADNNSESGPSINYPPFIYRDYSLTGFDRKHDFNLFGTYDLPFGPGESWLNHGVAGAIAGGWTVNAVMSKASGTPFSVSASSTSLNAPGNSQFANQLKSHVKILGGHGPNNPYFDPNAYAPVLTATFGNSGRNSVRGPGLFDLDASVFRNFPVKDWFTVQFRAEAFAVTNTPQFGNPAANVSNATIVGGAVTAYNGYDIITSAGGARQLRFAAKVTF
jgi:hypothetical protein